MMSIEQVKMMTAGSVNELRGAAGGKPKIFYDFIRKKCRIYSHQQDTEATCAVQKCAIQLVSILILQENVLVVVGWKKTTK